MKLTYEPNFIVWVWLKMIKIGLNGGLPTAQNLLVLGSINLNGDKLQF